MNNRFTLQDMAGLLATQTGRTKKDSEEFLRTLINVISEGVFDDRLVKVKGLGTFKIIEVEDRESINVNTGKRFVIPGHYKFNFSPDKDLKELVNKPFSFFDTTEINNEEKLQQLVATTEENIETGEEEEEREDEIVIQPPISPLEATVTKLSKIVEKEPLDPIKEEDTEVSLPKTVEETKAIIAEESETEEDGPKEITEYPVEEPVSDEYTLPTIDPVKQQKLLEQEDIKDSQNIEEPHEEEKEKEQLSSGKEIPKSDYRNVKSSSNKGNKTILIIILILLIGAIALLAYLFMSQAKQENPITLPQVETTVEPTTLPGEEDNIDDQQEVENLTAQAPLDTTKALAKIIIEPGSRLTLLALDYYGHKIFWVYIYEYNKNVIDDPNNVPVGTELVIPAPEVYQIDVKDRASIERASVLQTQIIGAEN